MIRRSIALGIVGVWIGALSWLGWRELGAAPVSDSAESARTVPPGAAYYVVSLDSTAVGYASHTIDTVPDGIQVDDRIFVELPTRRGIARTDARTVANLTNRTRLRDFETQVGSENRRYRVRVEVREDSLLTILLNDEPSGPTSVSSVSQDLVLGAFLPLRLTFTGPLQVGDTISVDKLEAGSMAPAASSIYVAAESTMVFPDSAAWDSVAGTWTVARWDTIQAWQVELINPEHAASLWIGSLGQLISATYPSGFALRRTAFEIAFHNFRARADSGSSLVPDGVFETAVAAGIESLDPPRDELRVTFVDRLPSHELLEDERQRFVGESLLVTAQPVDVVDPTLRIPVAGRGGLVRFMRPEVVIRSDDPRIAAQARLAVDGTSRAPRAAQRLVRWVYENIDRRPDVGVPSALHVLEARAGDSYEHAILFVAMARAIGLPARTVSGLLYVENRFFYHNWAEVHLGNGWLAVDPTFGQHPADASHLRLTYGGQPSDIDMVRLIGNLRVEVLGEGE